MQEEKEEDKEDEGDDKEKRDDKEDVAEEEEEAEDEEQEQKEAEEEEEDEEKWRRLVAGTVPILKILIGNNFKKKAVLRRNRVFHEPVPCARTPLLPTDVVSHWPRRWSEG